MVVVVSTELNWLLTVDEPMIKKYGPLDSKRFMFTENLFYNIFISPSFMI